MTRGRRNRPFASLALAFALACGFAAAPAMAQNEPAPTEGENAGRPLDGYLATACLVALALFIVGKSARR